MTKSCRKNMFTEISFMTILRYKCYNLGIIKQEIFKQYTFAAKHML